MYGPPQAPGATYPPPYGTTSGPMGGGYPPPQGPPPPPPPPKSNAPLIAGLIAAIVVVVCLVGAGVYVVAHRVAGPEVGVAVASADAGRADAAKPVVDAGSAGASTADAGKPAAPPVASKPSGAGTGPAPKEIGTCSCLPDQGTVGHGNNQRLASRYPAPMQCDCFTPSGEEVCLKLAKDGSCTRFASTANTGACAGLLRATGAPAVGQFKDCAFDLAVDTFPGPRGRACRGYMHNGKQVAGTTYCFGR